MNLIRIQSAVIIGVLIVAFSGCSKREGESESESVSEPVSESESELVLLANDLCDHYLSMPHADFKIMEGSVCFLNQGKFDIESGGLFVPEDHAYELISYSPYGSYEVSTTLKMSPPPKLTLVYDETSSEWLAVDGSIIPIEENELVLVEGQRITILSKGSESVRITGESFHNCTVVIQDEKAHKVKSFP